MTADRRPWLKWYPADWRAEPTLRMCSRAARSLWMDMLGLMHDGEPYGHLTVAGIVPTPKQLASLLGDAERELTRLLAELEAAGVFSRDAAGRIFCRRMLRDKAREDRDRANGKGGGNPGLKGGGKPPDKPNGNRPDNQGVNPPDKAQKPEARKEEGKHPASQPSTATARPAAPAGGEPAEQPKPAADPPRPPAPPAKPGSDPLDLPDFLRRAPGAPPPRPESALAEWWLGETEARWPGCRAVAEPRVLAIGRSFAELLSKHPEAAIRMAIVAGLDRWREGGHREPPKLPTLFRAEVDAEAVKQAKETPRDPKSERAFRLRYWLDRDCGAWLSSWGDAPADRAAAEAELELISRDDPKRRAA